MQEAKILTPSSQNVTFFGSRIVTDVINEDKVMLGLSGLLIQYAQWPYRKMM